MEERAAHGQLKAHRSEQVGVFLALDFGVGDVTLLELAEEEDGVGLGEHVDDAGADGGKEDEVGDGEGDVEEEDGGVDGEDGEGTGEEGELVGGDGDFLGVDALEEHEVVLSGTLALFGGGRVGTFGRLGFGHFFFLSVCLLEPTRSWMTKFIFYNKNKM